MENDIYIGKTTNMDRRMRQHFTGNGAQVTRKFAPVSATQIATCNGYFSNEVEQQITEEKIHNYGAAAEGQRILACRLRYAMHAGPRCSERLPPGRRSRSVAIVVDLG